MIFVISKFLQKNIYYKIVFIWNSDDSNSLFFFINDIIYKLKIFYIKWINLWTKIHIFIYFIPTCYSKKVLNILVLLLKRL